MNSRSGVRATVGRWQESVGKENADTEIEIVQQNCKGPVEQEFGATSRQIAAEISLPSLACGQPSCWSVSNKSRAVPRQRPPLPATSGKLKPNAQRPVLAS